MEPEPIPPAPRTVPTGRSAPEDGIKNLLINLHLPAFHRALKLHGTGIKVRACGLLMILIAVIMGIQAADKLSGSGGGFPLFLATLGGMITGYLVYAFGAYLSGCAEHHRSSLINAILNSPHVTAQEARETIQIVERRIEAGRY